MAEKRILIVDDEGSILTVLKSSLRILGDEYHVGTASSAYEALDHISKQNYDLVITDYKMAGMDGLQLLERIHALHPQTRVILMTAYGNAGVEAESTRLKAYRYLVKPLEIEAFRRVVREAFSGSAGVKQGLLVLSDDDYLEINQILQGLQSVVGARAVLLTDSEGKYIACSGDVKDLPLNKIASLLGGSLATLIEAGRSIDNDPDSTYLAYREGGQDNLFAVNVGLQFLLIIILQRGSMNSRLGVIWYTAQAAIHTLKEKFASSRFVLPGDVLSPNMEKAVSGELQKILAEPTRVKTSQGPDTGPLLQSENPSESDVPTEPRKPIWPAPPARLNLSEPRATGIVPRDFRLPSSTTSLEKDAPHDKS